LDGKIGTRKLNGFKNYIYFFKDGAGDLILSCEKVKKCKKIQKIPRRGKWLNKG